MRFDSTNADVRAAPAAWKPRLDLDEPTLLAARAIVAREGIAQGSAMAARKKIEALLQSRYPDRRIKLRLPAQIYRKINGEMSFVLFVDGAADQGLIFAEAKADGTFYGTGAPANDQ